ncbi:hypothetical protein A2397_03845 [Candidatus Amesbacteria bacterium RIFOXYB1_FULL_44_23]|uniref:Uncharacterized protein n=1 Tax=Candidatus Amesbacteria bacterium RIFOXYB1_FULL_44_23 TaxID=1797263 RepID=A0A1F4ZUP5_9BACT|nr:MAG: hypothetical protein A2397_03845 [Candidatus Amesbacteria bacterium RIFOXYB1_FULL_44_23]
MNSPRLLAQQIGVTTSNPEFDTIQNLTPAPFLSTLINLLLGFAGVASFVYLLWGGIQWITAGGDKDALDKARKKIVAAFIGLAVVFSSYAMLYIVRVLFNVNLIQLDLRTIGSASSTTGTTIPSGGLPSATLGNANCPYCGSTGCGITGNIYLGASDIHYICDPSGWQSTAAPVNSTTCGTCP